MKKIVHKYTNFANYTNFLRSPVLSSLSCSETKFLLLGIALVLGFLCFSVPLFFSFLVEPDRALAAETGLLQIALPKALEGTPFVRVDTAISAIFSLVVAASGAIFIVLFLVGATKYLVSAGNEEETTKAKKWLVDSIIGLIIVLSAWAIGNWIIGRLGIGTGSSGGGGSTTTQPATPGGGGSGGGVTVPTTPNLPDQPPTPGSGSDQDQGVDTDVMPGLPT